MIEGRGFAAASTVGARTRQEDDWGTHVNPPAREAGARLLAAVADGMGGMPAGEQASCIALRAFLDSYRVIDLPAAGRLRHALAHANREVGIAAEADPSLEGMGCTLVAALFLADRCAWLSVGDSLILRRRNDQLERINPLHVYANRLDEMVRRGEISADAARNDPERAALTSAIQGSLLEEVAQGELALEPGDVVMLASDGILTLPDDEIVSICAEQAEHGAQRIAQTIVDCIDARGRPGQDNATLVVIRHESGVNNEATVCKEVPEAAGTIGEEVAEGEARRRKLAGAPATVGMGDESRAPTGSQAGSDANTDRNDPDARTGTYQQDRGITRHESGEPQARSPLSSMRLLWVCAVFVLGAGCGIIGWYVFVGT